MPGKITFMAEVIYLDGTRKCGLFDTEIGVRTDFVVVIGWIDPDNVPLVTAGVDRNLLRAFPPSGPPVGLWGGVQIAILVSQGDVQPMGINLLEAPWAATPGRRNRLYLLNWLFKFTANPDPRTITGPADFRDATDTHIDFEKLNSYTNVRTNYKLFNLFQVRYLANEGGFTVPPFVLIQSWVIGTTMDPIMGAPTQGQSGPHNGDRQATAQSIWAINEGSPPAAGILAFNTLMGNAVPRNPTFWENIGSRIKFSYDNGTEPIVTVQAYPTFYVYHNGRLVSINPQAPQPSDHFYRNPYPFGIVPCDGSTAFGSIPHPHGGGRCGNAVAPEESSARIPPILP
jgi:hypothetical protein